MSLYFSVNCSHIISYFLNLTVTHYLENVPIIIIVRFKPAEENLKLCTVEKKRHCFKTKSYFSLTNKNISVKMIRLLCVFWNLWCHWYYFSRKRNSFKKEFPTFLKAGNAASTQWSTQVFQREKVIFAFYVFFFILASWVFCCFTVVTKLVQFQTSFNSHSATAFFPRMCAISQRHTHTMSYTVSTPYVKDKTKYLCGK